MRELARWALLFAVIGSTGPALASDDPFAAFRQRRFEDARRGFEELRARRPRDPAVAINLGSALYELGRYDEAAAVLRFAVETSIGAVRQQALYDLGNTAFRLERFDEAVHHFEEALKLDSTDADAAHNLELARQKLAAAHRPPPPPGGENDPPHPSSQPPGPGNAEAQNSPEPAVAPDSAATRTPPPMTRPEAERLLSSLEDQPPPLAGDEKRRTRGRAAMPSSGKDW